MTRTERIAALKAAAKARILILDGSWPAKTLASEQNEGIAL